MQDNGAPADTGTPADTGGVKPEGRAFEGKRILIVEDNELNREIASEFIHMMGAESETAEDGKKAVEKFAASPVGYYDMILMDILMPEMGGYEAAGLIRSMERRDAGTVPILAMTANALRRMWKEQTGGYERPYQANLFLPNFCMHRWIVFSEGRFLRNK